jgi:hypothetical protein
VSTNKNDKRRYVRLRLKDDPKSATCTSSPEEAADLMADDPDLEICGEVWLTQDEYEALPEFGGW